MRRLSLSFSMKKRDKDRSTFPPPPALSHDRIALNIPTEPTAGGRHELLPLAAVSFCRRPLRASSSLQPPRTCELPSPRSCALLPSPTPSPAQELAIYASTAAITREIPQASWLLPRARSSAVLTQDPTGSWRCGSVLDFGELPQAATVRAAGRTTFDAADEAGHAPSVVELANCCSLLSPCTSPSPYFALSLSLTEK
jgi:hypothetical protein